MTPADPWAAPWASDEELQRRARVAYFTAALRVGLERCRDRALGRRGLLLLARIGLAFATHALAAEIEWSRR